MPSSASFKPRDRYRLHATVARLKTWPFNIRTRLGFYFRAWVQEQQARVARTRRRKPPFEIEVQATSEGGVGRPTLYEDERERLWLLYHTNLEGVLTCWERYSDDDGASWSGAVSLFAGAKYAFPVVDPVTGSVLKVAYSSGVLVGKLRRPGDLANGTQFTLATASGPIQVADDTHSLAWQADHVSTLILTARPLDAEDPEEWVSYDDGRTFSLVT